MTKFTYLLAAVAASVMLIAVPSAHAAVELYGVKTYCLSGCSSGLYQFEDTPGSQPRIYWADGDMMGNGGAIYDGDKLYVLNYLNIYDKMLYLYQICDVDTKHYTFLDADYEIADIAGTTAYDPVGGTAYAICIDTDNFTNVTLNTINLADGRKTIVAHLSVRIYAMACDAKGTLYGIGEGGMLYIIDKYTGALTEVGSTGVVPENDQSAVIDYKTGIMYWSAYTAEGGALYTVDTSTGAATHVTTFNDSFQFTGLFIKQRLDGDYAPAPVEGLAVDFDGPALDGVASFALPTTTAGGNQLETDARISWTLMTDGEMSGSGTGSPGDRISSAITTLQPGNHRVEVSIDMDGQPGRSVGITVWSGNDTPGSVTDVVVDVDFHDLTVTWTLPERGVHGGYVDHSQVRYKIDRGPENITLVSDHEGNCFTDHVEGEGLFPVMYRIKPIYGELQGESIITTYVLAGAPFEPPFAIDMTNPYNQLVFDVEDANNDRSTWTYDTYNDVAVCMWATNPESDDWLLSKAISLKPGFEYSLEVMVCSEGKWDRDLQDRHDVYTGTLDAWLGTEPTSEAMTIELAPSYDLESVDWHLLPSEPFSVESEGLYYIGLHQTGVRSIYNTMLSSFGLSAKASLGNIDAIGSCFTATATAGAIELTNPACETVTVASLDGRVLHTTSAPRASLDLPSGIYIVAAPGRSCKVAVR